MSVSKSKVERVLKNVLEDGSLRPSGVVDGKLDKDGLTLEVRIPRKELSADVIRKVLSLLMTDTL